MTNNLCDTLNVVHVESQAVIDEQHEHNRDIYSPSLLPCGCPFDIVLGSLEKRSQGTWSEGGGEEGRGKPH
jgi:hypothetical protein